MSRPRQSGFTLIEMMITVVVIGILAAVAYPSYLDYIVRGNRSAAQSFMYGVAGKQEQYLLDARSYAVSVAALNMTVPTEVSSKYTITITCTMPVAPTECSAGTAVPGTPTYTITGTPIGTQVQDTKCMTITLNQAGAKGMTGGTAASATDCW